ncbi:protein L-Myc [Paroedura picta]|uniref:protein L-Myc n=1 Tax=Paroedura picta TaxID=143630 RepID=UPI0040574763
MRSPIPAGSLGEESQERERGPRERGGGGAAAAAAASAVRRGDLPRLRGAPRFPRARPHHPRAPRTARGPGEAAPAMELDPPHQPYFFEADPQAEDWHPSSAPSEDIWKKFELVPAPPLLAAWPAREEAATADYLLEPGGLLGNLSAFVLRDCMWSGFSARERLGKALSEKWAGPAAAPAASKPSCGSDWGLGGECVDPASVFPGPLGDGKVPASSGSEESPSDSEGEEIDVVTVEKRQSLAVRTPVTITVRADPSDPCMKCFHISIHQQQHNYAARSPPEACPQLAKDTQEEEEDEEEEEDNSVGPRSPGQVVESFSPHPFLPKSGSAPSSDSEDVTKRKNHNYLERKRRNDLRSRFLALRDQVPDLANCPKTPKVVILSKAAEYLQSLISTEQQMAAEKKWLKLQQQQLLKQISHLRGVQ